MSATGAMTQQARAQQTPWSGGPVPVWRMIARALVSLVISMLAVRIADRLLEGFDTGGHDWEAALFISVLSAIVSPLAVRLALPLFVYTAGVASLVLNALVVLGVARIDDEVSVAGFGTALLVSLIATSIAMIAAWALSLDDDATFARAVIRRQARRQAIAGSAADVTTPGIIFLEIDGCSHGVLLRALRAGHMPNLYRWLDSGTHRLHRWETDLSSQTGASQAGLLLGTNEGIVAFRWFERDRQEVVVSGKPHDAALLERRLSSGTGLLAHDGASRNNLLTGDAGASLMTLSTALEGGGSSRAWSTYFASADNVARTLMRSIGDIVQEVVSATSMRRKRVWPRLEKGWRYPLMRAGTAVVMPDVTVDTLVGDMIRGVPSAYATFVGYDEVAHHDGVERPSALRQLRLLDEHFGRLEQARRYAARPYEFVVLSDHGQSQGATFLQRYGESLEALVMRSVGTGHRVHTRTADIDSGAQLSGALTEATSGSGVGARLGRRAMKTGGEVREVELQGDGRSADDDGSSSAVGSGDLLVMASGNLGLVYRTGWPVRGTLEEIADECPGLVEACANHPGIGAVVVATRAEGTVAIGARGRTWLEDGRVEGEDPLAAYGDRALRHLRRHDRFEHMPDLLLLGTWWADVEEVAAFEELIGSHGGLGGEQSEPFVLAPSGMAWPEYPVVGAGEVHTILKGWIHGLEPAGTGR